MLGIPKVAAEDTTLVATNSQGERKTIPVEKGTFVLFNPSGLHYNRKVYISCWVTLLNILHYLARYWEDPHSFKPDRFLKDWPRDAFLSFSAGARACLGRK